MGNNGVEEEDGKAKGLMRIRNEKKWGGKNMQLITIQGVWVGRDREKKKKICGKRPICKTCRRN